MRLNRCWWAITGLLLLNGCSTAPHRVPKVETVRPQIVEQVSRSDDPNDLLKQAESATPEKRNLLLFKAAEIWQKQNQCINSIKIVDNLRSVLVSPIEHTEADLIEAECLLNLGYTEQAQKLAEKIQPQGGLQHRYDVLQARLLEQQQQWLQAARAWQHAALQVPAANDHIWPLLKRLTLSELRQAAQQQGPLLSWLQLAIITRQYSSNAYQLASALQNWKHRYPDHPAIGNMPADLDQAIHTDPYQPQHIAVLLPFNGRLKNQGEALKQGILAAYFEHENAQPELTFIDSTHLQPADMATLASQYDFILGPLDKSVIESVLSALPAGQPMLALNRIDTQPQRPQTYYFALAPEDEANQIAEHLLQHGIKKPVVIASSNSSMQRMVNTFKQHWQAQTQQTPLSVTFSTNKSMRKGIAHLLEVDQSKNRIHEIENMAASKMYSFYRNRQDVDAIVIFANAEETELLVPMIEASTSPFSDPIPVFGSSRSYSQQMGSNAMRDLRNLTFVDMPWMLPNHPWQNLQHSYHQLWPSNGDSLKRLFAMGYDAYMLIPHLRHMAILPELRVNGLTGHISMDQHDVLHEQLALGKISRDQVTTIALD